MPFLKKSDKSFHGERKKVVLLTLTESSILGGMETYSLALQRAIPGLRIWGRESIKEKGNLFSRLAREWAVAQTIPRALSLEKDPPSLVFSNGMMGAFLSQASPEIAAIPRISILHGTFAGLAEHAYSKWNPFYWRMRHLYAHAEKKSAQTADVCVANSSFTAQDAKQYYGVSPRVVEPPIDSDIFYPGKKTMARTKLNWSTTETHVLFVGNPTRSKGFDIVIGLARMHPEWIFDLVCVPKPELAISNVRLHDPRPLKELADFYRAADAVIFPSRYEGFGFVPLEALACGVPVVAGNVGVLPTLDLPNLIHVSEYTPKDFSCALKEIIKNPPDGKWGAKTVARRFTFESFQYGIHTAIKETIERGKRT